MLKHVMAAHCYSIHLGLHHLLQDLQIPVGVDLESLGEEVGGYDVGLVADEAQHRHSGGELGHYHDGDLALALPVHFFILGKFFFNWCFQIVNLTISVTLHPARRPLVIAEQIFSSEFMFLIITVCCCIDSEDDTIGYGCIQICYKKLIFKSVSANPVSVGFSVRTLYSS